MKLLNFVAIAPILLAISSFSTPISLTANAAPLVFQGTSHPGGCYCTQCRLQRAANRAATTSSSSDSNRRADESVRNNFASSNSTSSAQQVVFLDFDSATSGTDHVYTTSERDQIIERMQIDYGRFDFEFTLTAPVSGPFSTLTINDGPAFGIAEDIDFRNLNKSDNATIDVNSGATTSAEFVTLTANVASHELGHLVGLRHSDSFGPLGSGIDPNTVVAGDFLPDFPGPSGADETQFHLMESDTIFIENTFDQFFSERSAIKLAFNESGVVVGESAGAKNTLDTAQEITLSSLVVPNTIEQGADLVLEILMSTPWSLKGQFQRPEKLTCTNSPVRLVIC